MLSIYSYQTFNEVSYSSYTMILNPYIARLNKLCYILFNQNILFL